MGNEHANGTGHVCTVPVGIITAVFGAPLFLLLLLRMGR